jgi:hypothetical protein
VRKYLHRDSNVVATPIDLLACLQRRFHTKSRNTNAQSDPNTGW